MNPYRDTSNQPKIYSRLYIMMREIKNMTSNIWRWFSWENAYMLLGYMVLLDIVVFSSVILFCTTFLPHTFNGCYISSYNKESIIVYRDVSWESDPPIMNCGTDFNCAKEIINSDMCKK